MATDVRVRAHDGKIYTNNGGWIAKMVPQNGEELIGHRVYSTRATDGSIVRRGKLWALDI